MEIGLFKLEKLNIDFGNLNTTTQLTQSFIAETYGKTNQPICHFLCGFFVGVF